MTHKKLFSTAIALIIVFTLTAPAFADGPGAVAWLKTQQNADGGFGSPASSVGATADTILATAASGENAFTWSKEGKTPLDFIKTHIGSVSKAGDLAKVILALTANGMSPRTVLETDLIKKLEIMTGSDGKIGGEADFINEHCLSMIALNSAFRPSNPQTIGYLASKQIKDGTWSWNGDLTEGSGDNNTTAFAVLALIASGVPADNGQIQQALAHLKKQQNADGGFPYINPSPYGTDSDSNSTAVVMWAIIAAGQDPSRLELEIL
jgi:prenyltransferase beta subunit